MTLNAGTRLGPYEIVAPLGAGGMGEVYRAKDTRLGREVAIKVLPQHLSANAEIRARFEREAKTISSLNHPHICTLFDVGREGDIDYLVMELIEGETLAQKLARSGGLPVAEVVRLGAQIADALDRAHRAGVVHRDLKPGNVMLTRTGAKLMDFGLARATDTAGPTSSSGVTMAALSRTMPDGSPLTAAGTLVGTFQYMAPEQLEGRDADVCSDVWALGCVLYEMACGKRAFAGDSQASLIGAIMKDEPRPLLESLPLSPAALDRIVRICLAKDPEQRWQSAGDVGRMLRGLDANTESRSATGMAPVVRPRRVVTRERVAWGLALVLPVLVFLALRFFAPTHADHDPLRVALNLPRGTVYHFSGDFAGPPAITRDGKRVAFVALDDQHGASIWVRDLDRLDARPVPGTAGGSFPFWSPDGKSLGFWADLRIKRVDLESGAVVSLCKAGSMRGATWCGDGSIVVTREAQGGLWRVPAAGGEPVALTSCDTTVETTHRWPQLLPGGKNILYFAGDHRDPQSKHSGAYVVSRDGKHTRFLLNTAVNAVYADGRLLYLQDSVLFARPFDARTARFTGDAVATRERIQPDPTTFTSNVSASESGRLAYVMLGPTFGSRIEERGRDGSRLRYLTDSANHMGLYLSRDGTTLGNASQVSAAGDVWTIDVASGRRTLVHSGQSDDDCPVLSPHGDRLAFLSNLAGRQYGAFVCRSDGAGDVRALLASTRDQLPLDWSADGRFIIIGVGSGFSGTWDSLVVVQSDNPGAREVLLVRPETGGDARISPDGHWLAYSEGAYGNAHVVVVPFTPGWPAGTAPTARCQASLSAAAYPRWTRGGRELIFARSDGTLVAVDAEASGGTFRVGPERELFRVALRPQTSAFDVSPDGERFYINALSGDDVSRLAIVTNWTADLSAK